MKASRTDVMVSNIGMPDEDGYALIQRGIVCAATRPSGIHEGMQGSSLHEVREKSRMHRLPQLLEELTGLKVQSIEHHPRRGNTEFDAYIEARPYEFLVECKDSGTAAPVALATVQLQRATRFYDTRDGRFIPLIVVPFMSSAGKGICREAGIGWVDLAGNADISAPGLRIRVEGRPNRFERSKHGFGPRSSRVAHQLLLDPEKIWTIRELKQATGLTERFVASTVERLREDGLIAVTEQGFLSVPSPKLLLDTWHEVYDFSKHRVLRGHVASRTGEALLEQLSDIFQDNSVEHAATGLAAAWKLAPFAGFRLVTFYVLGDPGAAVLDSVGFRETDRGANVWLVLPNDTGVLQGRSAIDGVTCVSAVQTYLDLKAHPERAREAAEELRARHLTWSGRG